MGSELTAAGQRRRQLEDAVHRAARAIRDMEAIEREEAELTADGDPSAELRELRARCVELETAIRRLTGTLAELGAEQRGLAEQRRMLAARSPAAWCRCIRRR